VEFGAGVGHFLGVAKSGDAVLTRVGGSLSKISWVTGWLLGFVEDLRQSVVVLFGLELDFLGCGKEWGCCAHQGWGLLVKDLPGDWLDDGFLGRPEAVSGGALCWKCFWLGIVDVAFFKRGPQWYLRLELGIFLGVASNLAMSMDGGG
jgi:hypothetical protein